MLLSKMMKECTRSCHILNLNQTMKDKLLSLQLQDLLGIFHVLDHLLTSTTVMLQWV